MKNPEKIRALAEKHGVKTRKRLFVDDARTGKTQFLDVNRPVDEIVDDLVALGVLT